MPTRRPESVDPVSWRRNMGDEARWAVYTATRERFGLRPAPSWDVADRYMCEDYEAFKKARAAVPTAARSVPAGDEMQMHTVEQPRWWGDSRCSRRQRMGLRPADASGWEMPQLCQP